MGIDCTKYPGVKNYISSTVRVYVYLSSSSSSFITTTIIWTVLLTGELSFEFFSLIAITVF